MISSLKILFDSPFNKQNKFFAAYRFFYWKLIRLFNLKKFKYKLWDDRSIYLNYDSFQSMWIMYNYIVDWEEFNLISRVVKNGDHVFDIGSNIGFYTVWMSKFIGSEGKIHSFEPDEGNFKRLQDNVALNNLQNVALLNQIAISASNGYLKFTTGLDGENHIDKTGSAMSKDIPTKTLDSYVKDTHIESVAYVKIDVEGFEYEVILGAKALLESKKIGILQLEINSTIQNSNVTVEQILETLNTHQYSLCMFDVSGLRLVPIKYSQGRENYFAVYDIEGINSQLQRRWIGEK